MLFAAHNTAFHYWGGVPHQDIYGHLKTYDDQVLEDKERSFNPRLLALMNHYVTGPVIACPQLQAGRRIRSRTKQFLDMHQPL